MREGCQLELVGLMAVVVAVVVRGREVEAIAEHAQARPEHVQAHDLSGGRHNWIEVLPRKHKMAARADACAQTPEILERQVLKALPRGRAQGQDVAQGLGRV